MLKNKQSLIKLIAVVVAIAGIGFGLYYGVFRDTTHETSAGKPRNTVNYNGPTNEEKDAGNEQKEINTNRDESITTPQSASITITNTSQSSDIIRVRALISNVIENGGTCTTTLEKSGKEVKKVTSAFADATSTQCGAIDFSSSDFTPGTWNVKVAYSSSSLQGSANTTMTIE